MKVCVCKMPVVVPLCAYQTEQSIRSIVANIAHAIERYLVNGHVMNCIYGDSTEVQTKIQNGRGDNTVKRARVERTVHTLLCI